MFKAKCNEMLNKRKKEAGTHSSLMRGCDWKKAVAHIGQKNPGEDKRSFRDRVKLALVVVARLAQRAFQVMTEFAKRRFLVAFGELASNVEAIARDPTFCPSLDTAVFTPSAEDEGAGRDGGDAEGSDLLVQGPSPSPPPLFWIPEKTTQWCSELLKGAVLTSPSLVVRSACGLPAFDTHARIALSDADVRPGRDFVGLRCPTGTSGISLSSLSLLRGCLGLDSYFLCRTPGCQAFMPNTAWVVDKKNKSQHMCPVCAVTYAPWTCKGGRISANKILVALSDQDEPDIKLAKGQVMYWFVTRLESRLAEIALNVSEATRAMNAEQLDDYVQKRVNETAGRCFFQRRQLSASIRAQIDGYKSSGGRQWDYSHLLGGFYCTQAQFTEGVTPVMDNDACMTMWAYTRHVVAQTCRM